jgi:hypothetical protein
LESILQRIHEQYRQLAGEVQLQQQAMKRNDLPAMGNSARRQEAIRLRISAQETKRKQLTGELGRLCRVEGEMTIGKLAQLHPQRGPRLLELRDQLKATVSLLHEQMTISSRIAGAVLGHLNVAVQILASAAQSAGLYTKYGVPQVSSRLGIVEAVG